MKKVFSILVCVLLLGVSCNQQSTELTDEQKAAIIAEVGIQVDGYQSAVAQVDFNKWSEYFSEDEFNSVISNIAFYDTRSVWLDRASNWWSGLESRSIVSDKKSIAPLTQNLAFVAMTTIGSTVLKSGEKYSFMIQVTSIWKREEVGWKIIQVHESFQTLAIKE